MNVVDASGWIEYLSDGPGAGFFSEPIEDEGTLLVPPSSGAAPLSAPQASTAIASM